MNQNQYEKKLEEIELLLSQSMRGIHYLFDNEKIALVLQTPTEEIDFFNFDNMDKIQDLFAELIEKETVQAKRHFLESLDEAAYETLLRAYFHILDNTLLAATNDLH